MKKNLLLLTLCVLSVLLPAQNLIPNPSFEKVNKIVPRWSGTFSKFNRWMQTWTSPTQGSPDILFIETLGKMHPKRPKVDLTMHKPRTGKFMVGIKTFGCLTSTLHCKEYLQVKTKTPLKKGVSYYYEYWVSPIESSVKVNAFGLMASIDKIQEVYLSGLLEEYPIAFHEPLIKGDSIGWYRVSGTFEADEAYNYIIIGNFGEDTAMEFEPVEDGIEYGYYLIDDVLLRPEYPEEAANFVTNQPMVLEHILFEFDQAILQASSNASLNDLAAYLVKHATAQLKITGHTDAQGDEKHNLELSTQRAIAVQRYLVAQGIDVTRIEASGKGSQFPLVDASTEEAHQQNRRVEIEIIEEERNN